MIRYQRPLLIAILATLALTASAQLPVTASLDKKGHNVLALAVSPEGDFLATGGDDNRVVVWRVKDQVEETTFTGNSSWMTALAFRPGSNQILAGEKAGKISILDLTSNAVIATIPAHKGTIYSLDFHGRYNYVVSAGADGFLRIWDIPRKEMLKEIKVCENELMMARFSPDGERIITAGSDGVIKEYEVISANMVRAIDAHEGYIRSVAYSYDQKYVVSGGDDRLVKVWDATNGKLVKTLPKEHKKWIQAVGFAPDNLHIVSGGHDGQVIVYNLEKNTVISSLKQGGAFVSGSSFSADGQWIASAGYGGKTTLFNASSLNIKPVATQPATSNAVASANRSNHTEAVSELFEIVEPRITSDKFVCLDEEITIRGVARMEAGVNDLRFTNQQSKQSEKMKVGPGGVFEHKVKLAYLDNDIIVTVTDTKGKTYDKKITAYRILDKTNKNELARLSRSGRDYALVFATNKYQAMSQLVNPVLDATTIANELKNNYNFEVELIVDPSLDNIKLKIREYAKKMYATDDQLFIFIAGHGEYDDFFKEGYLVASDSKKEDEAKTTYLPHSTLRTYINNIPCNHIFLVMDVCFGGTFDQHLASKRGDEDFMAARAEFIKRKLKSKTRLYLTSGGKEYVPDGRPGHHSPFARKFIEALRTWGGQDKILTYTELLGVVEGVVPGPRFGEFGDNEPGADFLFISR